MYQHAKRDVHIFSEPRSQFKVQRAGPPRKTPLNYHQTPESVQSRIGVYPQQPETVFPPPAPVILDSHFGGGVASANVTTKVEQPSKAQTQYESSSTPLFPNNSYFPGFNVTNAYDSPFWKHLQNSRKEFEEFKWHLRGTTLLFVNWLATIYRLWLFAAWYIFTIASQAFLVKILIPQLSTVRSVVVPIFRYSVPVWILSIVGLALGANELSLSIEQARHTDYPVFDGLKYAHESIPMRKTVEEDVPAVSDTTSTVVRSSA